MTHLQLPVLGHNSDDPLETIQGGVTVYDQRFLKNGQL
jgi:hypothetical protein